MKHKSSMFSSHNKKLQVKSVYLPLSLKSFDVLQSSKRTRIFYVFSKYIFCLWCFDMAG